MHRKFSAAFGALFLFFTCGSAAFAAPSTRVLVVGDSHTLGLFGKGLLSVLDADADVDTAMVARCSSSPQHWLGDADVPQLRWRTGRIIFTTSRPRERSWGSRSGGRSCAT